MIYITKSADNISDAFKKKAIFNYLSCRDDSLKIRYIKNMALPDGWDITFEKNEFGKPYIKDADYNFSLSHTDGLYAMVIMRDRIGFDIQTEKLRFTAEEMKKIAHRFFVEDEQKILGLAENVPPVFYEIFTKKEALVKYDGRGLQMMTSLSCVSCERSFTDLTDDISACFGEKVYAFLYR